MLKSERNFSFPWDFTTITRKMKSVLVKVFHFVSAIQFMFGIYYEVVHVLPEELKLRKFSFGGKLIYLTFLNAVSRI